MVDCCIICVGGEDVIVGKFHLETDVFQNTDIVTIAGPYFSISTFLFSFTVVGVQKCGGMGWRWGEVVSKGGEEAWSGWCFLEECVLSGGGGGLKLIEKKQR